MYWVLKQSIIVKKGKVVQPGCVGVPNGLTKERNDCEVLANVEEGCCCVEDGDPENG